MEATAVAATPTSSTTDEATSTCEVCTYSAQHGWWGPGRTHHKPCHRTWSSLIEGHCVRCCEHFANVKAFDAHLTADGCQFPGDVIRADGKPRLTTREHNGNITWRIAFYGTRPDFAKSGTDGEDAEDGAETADLSGEAGS